MNAPGLAEAFKGELALHGVVLPVRAHADRNYRVYILERDGRAIAEINPFARADLSITMALANVIARAINERGGLPT